MQRGGGGGDRAEAQADGLPVHHAESLVVMGTHVACCTQVLKHGKADKIPCFVMIRAARASSSDTRRAFEP